MEAMRKSVFRPQLLVVDSGVERLQEDFGTVEVTTCKEQFFDGEQTSLKDNEMHKG
jgi:hypothetical protein